MRGRESAGSGKDAERDALVLYRGLVLHRARSGDPRCLKCAPIAPIDQGLVAVVKLAVAHNKLRREGALKSRLRTVGLQAARADRVYGRASCLVELHVVYENVALIGVIISEVELVAAARQPQVRDLDSPEPVAEEDIASRVFLRYDGHAHASDPRRHPW